MAKYHVNPNSGVPGVCQAQAGRCPFGGDDDHKDSTAAAIASFEKKMEAGGSAPTQKKVKKVPGKQGVLAFEELRYIDYRAQQREYSRRYHASQKLPTLDERREAEAEATAYHRSWLQEASQNEDMERKRAAVVAGQAHAHPDETLESLVTEGFVTEHETLHPAVESSVSEVAWNVSHADKATKEKFAKLPLRYYETFKANPTYNAGYSDAAFKDLVNAATELHTADPTWTPRPITVAPRSGGRYHPAQDRTGTKDMQRVGAYTYSLLEDYAKLKFGADKANAFWATVQSDTVNKPKISDYFKAVKNFKS